MKCLNSKTEWVDPTCSSPRPQSVLNDIEEEWVKLWDDFNWYADYIEDSRGLDHWKRKHQDIYAQGTVLGLSVERMNEIESLIGP